MKPIAVNLALLLFATVSFSQKGTTVNALIGDKSFVARFQKPPDVTTDETLRLQTHLAYVERWLQNKNVSHLNKAQRKKRLQALRLLHEYRLNNVFPKNYDYPERRPCFIDRDGNICAVGYLIEKTAGRELAEVINQKHQYDYLLDMNEEAMAQWASANGLTLEECAVIQPSYGSWPPGYVSQTQAVPVKTSYGIASGFAIGFNAGVNLLNLNARYAAGSKTLSYLGLIGGASQIVLGLVNIRKDETGIYTQYSYKAQNNLSYVNIAAGTATVFTSAVNLLLNKRLKDKRNAFNLYGYPAGKQQVAAGLSFTRTL